MGRENITGNSNRKPLIPCSHNLLSTNSMSDISLNSTLRKGKYLSSKLARSTRTLVTKTTKPTTAAATTIKKICNNYNDNINSNHNFCNAFIIIILIITSILTSRSIQPVVSSSHEVFLFFFFSSYIFSFFCFCKYSVSCVCT